MRVDPKTNLACATDPQLGDYWHEMLCGICVVVARDGDWVCICRDKQDDPDGRSYFFVNPQWIRIAEFKTWLSYESPGMTGRFWADVVPRNMPVESYAELIPPVPQVVT